MKGKSMGWGINIASSAGIKKNSPAEAQQNCLNYLLIHQINQKAEFCGRWV
jgi:hypothetical protein